MENKLKRRHFFKNQKGQVAIFVALIFQVLFVFFAMIVNVGLLVHHKINLQNSVDLAAYYGAMKQAEMLNAISHVNYQIRQSFKLLTFRYQQLGSAGTAHAGGGRHPYQPAAQGFGTGGQILRDNDQNALSYDTSFCLPYTPVSIVNQRESYCRNITELIVPLPGVPNIDGTSDFLNFENTVADLAQTIRQQSAAYCRYAMSTNWFQLAHFIGAYKEDIRNRKKLIIGLAGELSKQDPRDIQGESIKQGVYRTLIKNLTYPNSAGLKSQYGDNGDGAANQETEFKFLNSFAADECRGNPAENNPPAWLKEVYVFPMYAMFDAQCGENEKAIRFMYNWFNQSQNPTISPNIPASQRQQAESLARIASDAASSNPNYLLYRTSLGFEKNPWCVGYVGVSAKTTPRIPFSPQGSVTLKATAYAKPFGGRVGPWYGTTWSPQANQSDPGKLTDRMVPSRIEPQIDLSGFNKDELKAQRRIFVNHSRYLGDTLGVLSEMTLAHFARAIYERLGPSIDLNWYNHISQEQFDNKDIDGDILAWDNIAKKSVPLRDLEIAAIAPDAFDAATYSIDPDFYNNYLTKIQKGYGSQFKFALRGDLGSRMKGTDAEKRFSIRSQIQSLTDPTKVMVDAESKLTYFLNRFTQVLTSWHQNSPDQYVLDRNRFGNCEQKDQIAQDADPKFFTAGSCKSGGRTGYSVKLVDGKFLRNEINGSPRQYELGGRGITGNFKNPPPNDF